MHVHMQVNVCARVHINVYHAFTDIHVYEIVSASVFTCACLNCTGIQTNVYVGLPGVFMCIHVHIHIHMYTYIYVKCYIAGV